MTYIDLTGRFPYRSAKGNEYLFVAYHFDGNAILAEPIKNRESLAIVTAWEKLNSNFKGAGV